MSVHAGSLLKVLTQFLRLSRLTSVTHILTTSLKNLLIFGGWVSHRCKDLGPPGAYPAVLLILQRRSFQFCGEQLKVHLFWTVVTLMELVVIPSAKTFSTTQISSFVSFPYLQYEHAHSCWQVFSCPQRSNQLLLDIHVLAAFLGSRFCLWRKCRFTQCSFLQILTRMSQNFVPFSSEIPVVATSLVKRLIFKGQSDTSV